MSAMRQRTRTAAAQAMPRCKAYPGPVPAANMARSLCCRHTANRRLLRAGWRCGGRGRNARKSCDRVGDLFATRRHAHLTLPELGQQRPAADKRSNDNGRRLASAAQEALPS